MAADRRGDRRGPGRGRADARDKKRPRQGRERTWARVELRAPLAGTVLEKNVTVGDIVATTSDLFKIADLRRLAVWAHIYEEDLPVLLALPSPIAWTVRAQVGPRGRPPVAGTVEEIGDIIDPNQHTALVTGHVDNPTGRLRAGQFIVAADRAAAGPGRGRRSRPPPWSRTGTRASSSSSPIRASRVYALRRVTIARHVSEVAYVRGRPSRAGPRASSTGRPSRSGERVVSSGARRAAGGR